MKTLKLVLLLTSVALLVGSHPAMGIDLTEYEFPVSTSQQAYVNGAFNLSGSSTDSTQTAYTAGGTASYDLFYRSLPLEYQLNGIGNFSFLRSGVEGAGGESGYDARITTQLNKYFRNDTKFFGFGAANLEYRRLPGQDTLNDPYADVTVGLGYGRSINATVLKQAVRISDDFLKYGITKGEIPDEGLLELAQILDKRNEFQSKYGPVEYRKYWYKAMEDILRPYNVLAGEGIGAWGAIRIEEVLVEPTGLRFHGWHVSAGVGMVISDFDGKAGDPLLSVEFDWARPIGMQLQLTNNAFMNTVFQDNQSYNVGDEFQVYYEISNRIDWDNRVKVNYTFNTGNDIITANPIEDVLALTASSTYILYLENRLTFNPSFTLSYLDDGVNKAQTNWVLLGSISYRLK